MEPFVVSNRYGQFAVSDILLFSPSFPIAADTIVRDHDGHWIFRKTLLQLFVRFCINRFSQLLSHSQKTSVDCRLIR